MAGRDMAPEHIPVWDLPVRVFHWALVLLIAFSWWSGNAGGYWLKWHFWSGYAILTLLVFRLLWGLAGSSTARFAGFLRGPGAALAHLRHMLAREPDREVGHNPLGGWMVVALLFVLAVQTGTGLFTDDDIATSGPLAGLASYDTVQRISSIHRLNFDLILILAGLHVAAVILYFTIARHNLILPMFTGRKPRLPGMTPARMASLPLALLLLAISALAVWGLVSLG